MQLTTLCYIEKEGSYLMLHRIKKKQDINQGKWIGLGGHLEAGESPEDCLLREIKEECGLTLTNYRMRGIVSFCPQGAEDEYMFLYTADAFEGELTECNEGVLAWVEKEKIMEKELWEGDRVFLKLLQQEAPFFSLKLSYEGERLVQAVLDGAELSY